MTKKGIITIIILGIIVIGIIAGIFYIKSNGNHDEKLIKCIAKDSKLIVSKTCSACAYQKQILGNYLNYFELISVDEHPEIFEQYDIKGVPTWIINNQEHIGVQKIEKLKELTGC